MVLRASLVAQLVKNSGDLPLQCGGPGFNPWVGKIPWRRAWQPTPVFLPEKPHGQRSMVGHSPQGRKQSNMTEQLSKAKMLKQLKEDMEKVKKMMYMNDVND